MKIGDLVRIKQLGDPRYVGKLAIVVVKGTWSVDVHIIDSNNYKEFLKSDFDSLAYDL